MQESLRRVGLLSYYQDTTRRFHSARVRSILCHSHSALKSLVAFLHSRSNLPQLSKLGNTGLSRILVNEVLERISIRESAQLDLLDSKQIPSPDTPDFFPHAWTRREHVLVQLFEPPQLCSQHPGLFHSQRTAPSVLDEIFHLLPWLCCS